MSAIVPFGGKSNVPAFLQQAEGNLAGISAGVAYPVISLKGKVFTLKDGDEQTLITRPGSDEPASALEVVILDVGPSVDGRLNNRVFYLKNYEEGSVEKPDCYSNDGVAPAADAGSPQAKKCALCPHNVAGSSATGKGKRCSSSKRLAVATPDHLDKPMMLRIPGGSLMAWGDYAKWMVKQGVKDSSHVVTKIAFDYSVAHPALTFKGLGWVTQDPAPFKAAEIVQFITGKATEETHADEPESELGAAPAFVQEAPAIEAPKAAPKAKAKPAPTVSEDDDLPAEPVTQVKVEGKKREAVPEAVEAPKDMGAALDDLDFDFDA